MKQAIQGQTGIKDISLMGTGLLAMLSGVDSLSGIQDYVGCHA